MTPILLLAAASAFDPNAIIVTGSREPIQLDEAALSATVIDRDELDALALPDTSDVLRLVPGVSVATSGPRGTQTQVRIRGAEANHTLLFVDGIRFNDPAAGNEARFELLTNDGLSRIEVVRGPQSALWGSEALGGVVAVDTTDPLKRRGVSVLGEYGSLDSARASVAFAARSGDLGLSGAAGWLSSDGIDSSGIGGERDGFDNRSASLKAVFSPLPSAEFGLVGHWVEGKNQFDGFDPVTFRRADTLDSTDNRIAAARAWASVETGGWALNLDGSILDSANRNRLAGAPLNSTFGRRFTVSGQVSKNLELGGTRHRLTGAIDYEAEDFRARDQSFFGATDQDRSRSLTALIGEWRADWSAAVATDVAVRSDRFSAFADATTVRASLLVRSAHGWSAHIAYGEGIAQPTFYDLYGFFPGQFVGNPMLRPERSKGWEAGLRWDGARGGIGITGFSNKLRDEIVDTFDPATFLSSTANDDGTSRRKGIELDADYRWNGLRFAANYTYLDADQQQVAGTAAVRELRRPRHSANLIATGSIGAIDLGASLAYVGKRKDTDFDVFPARTVTLDDYVLASLDLGYRITGAIEAYARVENAFGADYQDVVGYNTPGRTVYAGLRLRLGR